MIQSILIIILCILLVFFIGFFILVYNGLIRLKNNIEKSWSNIDVLLKQRQDELENLVSSVKGYMKHEKNVLQQITDARTSLSNSKNIQDFSKTDKSAGLASKHLFAVMENYPELKANDTVLHLQKRISDIENMIADRREFFNDSVTIFNTRIEQIPYVFLARFLGYCKKELFQANESKVSAKI